MKNTLSKKGMSDVDGGSARSLSKILSFCKKWHYELIMGGVLVFLLLCFLYNLVTGKKGTYEKVRFVRQSPRSDSDVGSNLRLHRPPSSSKGEIECRRVLEKLFRKPFPNSRPDFMNNSVTGQNLEIDCFNKELRIGVEYSGQQHYKFTPFFHRNHEAFRNQQYRDEMKRRLCKDNGVYLIEVPYTVRVEDIEGFLLKRLRKILENSR